MPLVSNRLSTAFSFTPREVNIGHQIIQLCQGFNGNALVNKTYARSQIKHTLVVNHVRCITCSIIFKQRATELKFRQAAVVPVVGSKQGNEAVLALDECPEYNGTKPNSF